MARTPAQIRTLRQNPATRAALPDRQLTHHQLMQRLLNRRLAQPIVQGSSVTNRDLAHQRSAAEQLQFGPEQQQLQQQYAGNDALQANQNQWFRQYQQDVANAAARSNQAFQTAQQQVTGATGATFNLAQQQAQQVQGQAQASAAQRGATAAPNTDAQLAAIINRRYGDSLAAQVAQQAAGAQTAGAERTANVAGFAAQAMNQAGQKRQLIDQAATKLAADRGAFRTNFDATTKENEFKNVLARDTLGQTVANDNTKNQIAANALGVNASRAAETARHNRAAETTARMKSDRTYQLDLKKFGASQAKDNYQRQHRLGPYKPGGSKSSKPGAGNGGRGWLPGTQQTGAQSTIGQAETYFENLPKGLTADQVQQYLVGGWQGNYYNIGGTKQPGGGGIKGGRTVPGTKLPALKDPLLIRAGREVAEGGLLPETVQKLHARRIQIGDLPRRSRVSMTDRPT